MTDTTDDQIKHYQQEIDRLARTIAEVEHAEFAGPMKYEVLHLLRSSLALHGKTLANLKPKGTA